MTQPQDLRSRELREANVVSQGIERNEGQAIGQVRDGEVVSIGRDSFRCSSGGVIYLIGSGSTAPPGRDARSERLIPPLLPYLADRNDQEYVLKQAVQEKLTQNPTRPLLCFIHGDENQAHDAFLDRLCQVSLPRLLKSLSVGLDVAVKTRHIVWPSGGKHPQQLHERLRTELANAIADDSLASIEYVNQTLADFPGPVVMHTHLNTEDWERPNSKTLLPALIDFWQNWPDLLGGRLVLVCACIGYQREQHWNGFGEWILRPFSTLRRFLKCRRYRKLNGKIRTQLKTLVPTQCTRLTAVVLPELEDLTQSHVQDWARSDDTATFIKRAELEKERLLGEIQRMFEEWEKQTASDKMSMREVGDRLAGFLKQL
ncbi:hypothetical protein KR51_00018960 [Rubidibacter lacunae KORDI 51-2]|uniref:Inactive STAND domain-containing protein n=1 Tax=Rubidibacter lacunae KORDI 51-2 TaxID=582515 RepID=U5DNP7_9CHRO|nr:hypothetical protein [Rubidibacter lacunae]ERN41330.1 hypothetical protein KR51_00018960 [Rubidibacter lacunae KORDI 51-2]